MDRETNRRVKMERSSPYPAVTGKRGGRGYNLGCDDRREGKGNFGSPRKDLLQRGEEKKRKVFRIKSHP